MNDTLSGALLSDFRAISHKILNLAHRGTPRFDFLRETAKILLDYASCDAMEVRTGDYGKWFVCEVNRHPSFTAKVNILKSDQVYSGKGKPNPGLTAIEILKGYILSENIDRTLPYITDYGSFCTGDVVDISSLPVKGRNRETAVMMDLGTDYKSVTVIPFAIDSENRGLLHFSCIKKNAFTKKTIEFYEGLASILGIAVATRRTQIALRERVKELTCLYGIVRLVEDPDLTLDQIMEGIIELIPPGWLYPDITSGRITLDGRAYKTKVFRGGSQKLTAPIIVDGHRRGEIEVIYAEERRELDEGPFLKEERNLIDAIAKDLAHILERKQAEEEKGKLQDQLRHADRLATIGQLAAGVAHELNEPLGNILGFAQLAQKSPGLPEQAEGDLSKIVNASLHAREIIKKLMVFARQAPSHKRQVNLNTVVEEGLYFFEARCAKAGIKLVRELAKDLPEITADSGLLNQVLVNLVVNSIQAMPEGGTLTVQTKADAASILLVVEDTGSGMDKEVLKQIFIPFFTTKDVDEGTGLGLPVVHGIVMSHRGMIHVESQVGKGTRFEIQLPLHKTHSEEETGIHG